MFLLSRETIFFTFGGLISPHISFQQKEKMEVVLGHHFYATTTKRAFLVWCASKVIFLGKILLFLKEIKLMVGPSHSGKKSTSECHLLLTVQILRGPHTKRMMTSSEPEPITAIQNPSLLSKSCYLQLNVDCYLYSNHPIIFMAH